MVTCAALNLAADGYHAATTNTNAMDLILCRNVLMYLTRETQRAAVAGFQRALVSGGWLMVSPAEASADIFSPLAPMNFPSVILYRKAFPPPVSFPAREEGRASQEERTIIPPDMPTDLQRARTLADRGHLEQARHLCEAALAQGRLALEPYLLLAVICQEQGEGRAAAEALRRAIYLAPDSAPAHYILGNLLLQQGQSRRARRCMEIVVHLLHEVPRDEAVPGGDGVTAGRLLEMARAYLESRL
jgi:chemotaxis protein methyltransferase CheR